jgi:arabinose-5-phosphate isomerase
MPRDNARRVLELEARAILDLIPRLDEGFDRAVEMLHICSGRVVVTGMGKSGLIGMKIAATFSSTGTPSLFLHPAEAVHGDIGMVVPRDVVVAISNSGETAELLALLELLRRIEVGLIALTGVRDSTLSRYAQVSLDVGIEKEATPIGLVPTASTTAALAMGDALAVALMDRRGFSTSDYARLHPGGRLGRNVLTVATLMHTGDTIPRARRDAPLSEVIRTMSEKKLGMCCVVDPDGRLAGIITDGDLRRVLGRGDDLLRMRAQDIMVADPVTIDRDELAARALSILEAKKITSLIVVDSRRQVDGVLHIHDLWRTQLF